MKTKICIKCRIEKDIIEFYKNKRYRYGVIKVCKDCRKLIYEKTKNYPKIKSCRKKYRQIHKKDKQKYDKKYNQEHKKIIKKYREERKTHFINLRKIYYQNHKEEARKYKKRYLKITKNRIQDNLKRRINSALHDNIKARHTKKLIGCSIKELKQYLESKFKKDMNWENYGFYGWHIDHIKPCASFDLSKPEEQRKCFHYTNLQPLWAEENQSKGVKYEINNNWRA